MRRIHEGASFIRTKGAAGTGDVIQVRPPPHPPTHAATTHRTNLPTLSYPRLPLLTPTTDDGHCSAAQYQQAVFHTRTVADQIRALKGMDDRQLEAFAAHERVPVAIVEEIRDLGRLPVVNFAAGGVATPADAALMMQLGCDGVFVGSGIFKSGDAAKRATAIVQSVTHFNDAAVIAKVSEDLGEAMVGIACDSLMGKNAKYALSKVPE